MKQNPSAFETLLEALEKSGLNVDDFSEPTPAQTYDPKTGQPQPKEGSSKTSSQGSSSSSGSSKAKGWGDFAKKAASAAGAAGFGGTRGAGFGGFGHRGSSGSSGTSGSADAGGTGSTGGTGSSGGGRSGGRGGLLDMFGFKFGPLSKKTIIKIVIIALVVIAAAYWWFHPAINIHSTDLWMFMTIVILFPLFLVLISKSRTYKQGTESIEPSPSKAGMFRKLSYIPVAVLVIGLIGGILSMSFFPGNAAKYANVLQTDTLDFSSDIQEVNYSEIPVIDKDSAVLLGNREMGSIPEYVSQFEISDLYSQINYQGTPVRVSPLSYADLFKWLMNREPGIPAYSLVNMTTQEAQIVRLDDEAIRYSESEPLARNIDRYVQLKYPFYMFDEKSFEIDEDGHPWWVMPVQKRTIGLFGGTTIQRVVLCDACTGECIDYDINDVPEWIDRAYPSELLVQQYNWSGKYSSGWINSWLGQSGVVQTTPGSDGNLGYNYIAKDDDVWVYTGVTSATSDSSIVGFVLINQRTAESHFYSVSGATEDSAMESAEGQVQNLRYTATFPLLINVGSQPTYFMALKDNAGLVKQFAMIDIQRYQNVAVGDTVANCQKSYEALLASTGVMLQASDSSLLGQGKGVITHMATAVIDSNSHFYVTLEGDSNIYDFALPSMLQIVAYQEGDTIEFKYAQGSPTCTVTELISGSEAAS